MIIKQWKKNLCDTEKVIWLLLEVTINQFSE